MKSNIYKILGQRSVYDVSLECGVRRETIYAWQANGSKIYAKFKRLAKALGCSMDDLFTLEDSDEE